MGWRRRKVSGGTAEKKKTNRRSCQNEPPSLSLFYITQKAAVQIWRSRTSVRASSSKLSSPSLSPSLGTVTKIRKPKPWKHPQPITMSQLEKMREEFWDTAPHYGGRKEIWDALHAAATTEINLAQAIIDCAGIIAQSADMTVCYDERGAKYELPKYVLSEPTNLIPDNR